jgi:hypothetical protein
MWLIAPSWFEPLVASPAEVVPPAAQHILPAVD